MHSCSDRQLIDNYCCGCQSSIEELIQRYKNRVFYYLYLLVRDHHLTDDLFQETFIRVINSLKAGEYRDDDKFFAWVRRIAHNVAMDHFRYAKRIPYIRHNDDRDIFDDMHIKVQSAEEKLVTEQIHNEMICLLDYLPVNQKEIIIMRHYHDMSFREIAEELGISTATATGRMRHALTGIRKIIKKKAISITG
jgi:RNA polymerase sigma-70 factor (ECF subfamily)